MQQTQALRQIGIFDVRLSSYTFEVDPVTIVLTSITLMFDGGLYISNSILFLIER